MAAMLVGAAHRGFAENVRTGFGPTRDCANQGNREPPTAASAARYSDQYCS